MPLSTRQIHSLVRTLDPNCGPEMLPIASIVLDITLNGHTRNSIHLAIRHKCKISLVTKWMYNLHLNGMLYAHWLEDDGNTINTIEFWLHVLVAQGKITTMRNYFKSHTFGPMVTESNYKYKVR